jgi:hypothetical protein
VSSPGDGEVSSTLTELLLSGGERLRVEGRLDEVEVLILSADRGSLLELAWLTDAESGQRVGINPDHVVMLRSLGPV